MTKREEMRAEEFRVEYLHGYQAGLKTACFIAPCSREAFEVEIHIKEKQIQAALSHLCEMLLSEEEEATR
jgi:hypothetical protein